MTWENVVAACKSCNREKGSRTPREAAMELKKAPKKPLYLPIVRPGVEHAETPREWLDYLRVVKRFPERVGRTPRTTDIHLTLADGTEYPQPGRIRTIERAVNPSTGTLGVEILFPNPGSTLRPGQYGRARILLDTRVGALLVPQRAVQELQGLYSVAVVDGKGQVTFRHVKVGPREDTMWVIDEGLTPGDQVVVEGVQAVRDGMIVQARPMSGETPVSTSGQAPVKAH